MPEPHTLLVQKVRLWREFPLPDGEGGTVTASGQFSSQLHFALDAAARLLNSAAQIWSASRREWCSRANCGSDRP